MYLKENDIYGDVKSGTSVQMTYDQVDWITKTTILKLITDIENSGWGLQWDDGDIEVYDALNQVLAYLTDPEEKEALAIRPVPTAWLDFVASKVAA